jgi:hypothetical protein
MAPFYRNDFLTRIEATKPQCRDPLATDRRDGQVVEGG